MSALSLLDNVISTISGNTDDYKQAIGRTNKSVKVRKLNIEGLIAATYTPFDNNDKVNLSAIPSYAKHLSSKNVKAVFVNGTTGESLSLSLNERKLIIKEWVQAAKQYKLLVIAMVGTNNIPDSQDLALHAASIGVDGISCMSPSFFQPSTVDSLISYIKPIADTVPHIPFYYYHIPSLTNNNGKQQIGWNMFDLINKIDLNNLIPNFVGLKYTGMYATFLSFADIMNIISYKNNKYEVFGGRDEMVLQLLCSGVKAFVGLSYNFVPNIYYDIINNFNKLNLEKSRQISQISHTLIKIQMQVSAGKWGHKYLANLSGIDCGDVRSPAVKLTNDDKNNLKNLAKEWNEKWKNANYDVFRQIK